MADLHRRRLHGRLVAVTGSSGKSTTASLLSHILEGVQNTEELVQPKNTLEIFRSVFSIEKTSQNFVMELSIAQPGHLRSVLKLVRPSVGIVTMIGLEHHKLYRTRENIAAEKSELPACLPADGLAVLNADDELVMAMKTRARCVTFGRDKPADYRVRKATSAYPSPLAIDVEWKMGVSRLQTRIIGEQFWLPVVAAFAAAIEMGVPPQIAVARIEDFQPLPDRCQPYWTANGPAFLLDTKKAPLHSLDLAFDVMRKAGTSRKVIVLGQISDFPGNANPKYRDAYRSAANVADQVIFVGEHSHRSKATSQEIESGKFRRFATVKQASEFLQENAARQDLILLKSSKSLHLERLALAWDHDVRCWPDKCGIHGSCFECGLFEFPFDSHDKIRMHQKKARESGKFTAKKNGGNTGSR